jgi:chromosome segregation ATPase
MKRDEIKEIIEGITKEQLDKIMDINGADIEKAKANLATVQQQVEQLQSQLKDRDKQLADLKNEVKDNEDLKSKITALEQANAAAKTDYDKKISEIQRTYEIEGKLRDAKAKNVKAAMAMLDLDSKDDIDTQIKTLRENEATSFLFESDNPPGIKGTTPAAGGETPPTGKHNVSLTEAVQKALTSRKD